MRKTAIAIAAFVALNAGAMANNAKNTAISHMPIVEQKADSLRRSPLSAWNEHSDFFGQQSVSDYVLAKQGYFAKEKEKYALVFRLGHYKGERLKVLDKPVLIGDSARISHIEGMADDAIILVGKNVPDSLAAQFSKMAGFVFVFSTQNKEQMGKKGKNAIVYPKIFLAGQAEPESGRKRGIFMLADNLEF